MSIDIAAVENMDSTEFARWVGSLSDAEASTITGEERRRLLDYIFNGIPDAFQADLAGGGSARLEFTVTGGEPDDRYAVVVDAGTCRIERDPSEEPGASLTMGQTEFLRLITGMSNPVTMVMFGKIKVKGELQQVLALSAGSTCRAPDHIGGR